MDAEVEVEDVAYARPGGEELLARLYRPAGAGPFAAVVEVHPGAWSEGDRTWGRVYCEGLARRGFLVASLDFRQGPRFSHPAASADVATGVRWLRASASRLGVDPARVGLVGSSSGGHLATLAACRPNAAEHAGRPLGEDGEPVSGDLDASVGCVAALWPPLAPDTRYAWLLGMLEDAGPEDRAHYGALRDGMDSYFLDRETMRRASVTRIAAEGEATHLPPVWVCHPELDRNVPEHIVRDFEAAWRAAGGEVSVSVYAGQPHAFGHGEGEATDRMLEEMAAFFARHL